MAATPSLHRIPYRHSIVTRFVFFSFMWMMISFLREAIGGDCKCTLIVTVSPNAAHFQATSAALEFATCARGSWLRFLSHSP